ncbi:hypothetical protein ACIBI4_26835 [Streptomyces sp. NPDC050418]
MSHTAPERCPNSAAPQGERITMNVITNIVAGLANFLGWLV